MGGEGARSRVIESRLQNTLQATADISAFSAPVSGDVFACIESRFKFVGHAITASRQTNIFMHMHLPAQRCPDRI